MTIYINGTTGISGADGSASTPAIQGADTNTGVFFPAADTVAVATGGSERVRVDSSGNVGIGTSSPSVKLQVTGGSTGTLAVQSTGTSGSYPSSGAGMEFVAGSGSAQDSIISYNRTSSAWRDLYLQANTLLFGTAGTERARINANGTMGIGVAGQSAVSGISGFLSAKNALNDGSWGLALEQTGTSNCRGIGISYGYAPNSAFAEYCYFIDTSATRFAVRSNGGIANYSGNNVNLSDRREKTNFAPAGEWLPKICAIPVQIFNYADQNLEEDPGLTLGVVAQDVQAVAPELVMESNWGTAEEPKMRLSIYQTDLQYALMKSIQELKAELDALKAQVAGAQA